MRKGLFRDGDVLLDPLRMVEVAAWFASWQKDKVSTRGRWRLRLCPWGSLEGLDTAAKELERRKAPTWAGFLIEYAFCDARTVMDRMRTGKWQNRHWIWIIAPINAMHCVLYRAWRYCIQHTSPLFINILQTVNLLKGLSELIRT